MTEDKQIIKSFSQFIISPSNATFEVLSLRPCTGRITKVSKNSQQDNSETVAN